MGPGQVGGDRRSLSVGELGPGRQNAPCFHPTALGPGGNGAAWASGDRLPRRDGGPTRAVKLGMDRSVNTGPVETELIHTLEDPTRIGGAATPARREQGYGLPGRTLPREWSCHARVAAADAWTPCPVGSGTRFGSGRAATGAGGPPQAPSLQEVP